MGANRLATMRRSPWVAGMARSYVYLRDCE